jgi:hypothetical protein
MDALAPTFFGSLPVNAVIGIWKIVHADSKSHLPIIRLFGSWNQSARSGEAVIEFHARERSRALSIEFKSRKFSPSPAGLRQFHFYTLAT